MPVMVCYLVTMESRTATLFHSEGIQSSEPADAGQCSSFNRMHNYLKVRQYKYNGSITSLNSSDTFDFHDEEDEPVNSNAPSLDNIYESHREGAGGDNTKCGGVPTGSVRSLPEVKVNMDPTERLIEAVESLREAIVENTSIAHRQRSRRKAGAGRVTSGMPSLSRANGMPMLGKDDKLRIRKEKVIVELRVVFLKIGEIDTLKEQYSADTFIQAKWREPGLDGKTIEELKRTDLDKFWNPLLYIENILSETKEATWLTATCNSRGEAFVLERRRIRGIFMENLELNDFPLDCQDLTITITSERPDTEIDLIPDENEMSGINVQTFVDQQEWRLHEHIEVSKKMMTQEYSSSNRCHPALSVTCRASRRPGYFYWNVFLVMRVHVFEHWSRTMGVKASLFLLFTHLSFNSIFLAFFFFISALSFATFAVSPELPQNRLQLSFTLLLTSVAFKFVINQSLPKISYLTYMDKYVLLSLAILCVVSIWHAVVTVFTHYGSQFLLTLERDVFIAFCIIYVLCHLVFIFWLYFDACKRRRIMKTKDKEYLEFLAKKKEWLEKTKEFASSSRRQSTMLLHSVHAL